MEVILLERIQKLGSMGEVVKVKDGYARNYLFPQHKALRATDANRAKFERDRTVLEAKNEERRKAAMGDSGKLEGKSFVILRQAGESAASPKVGRHNAAPISSERQIMDTSNVPVLPR